MNHNHKRRISKKEYEELLEKHNWFYYQSDVYSTSEKGFNESVILKAWYDKQPELRELYDAKKKSIIKP